MRTKLAILAVSAGLLAACGSKTNTAATTATGGGAGTGGGSGISSSGLGGFGAGGVQPGSQADLEVNVGDKVYFGFDSSTLDQAARQTLDRQAQWMQQFANVQVLVEGHTDERGTREYNLALGERRASEARGYLTASGISPSRVTAVSYGEERPADVGHDESAYALNRRAVSTVSLTQ